MKKGGLVLLYIFSSIFLYAAPVLEDSLFTKKSIELLQRIEQLQVKEEAGLLKGAFPSSRKYYFSRQFKQEDNVFFTALVLFNIGQFSNKMHPAALAYLEQLKTNARPYIERFKNQKNQLTYN